MLRAGRSRPDRGARDTIDERTLAVPAASPNPERLAAGAESGHRIQVALDRLKPVERAAFTLRHFDGCSIEEIAHTLGLGANNVKQHIFRAIRKLRVTLDVERSGS
jgi:RNA polymerase sigma-70 factor (ECF subfamily)